MRASISTLYFSELGSRRMVRLFSRHGWGHLELSECHARDILTGGDPVPAGSVFRRFAAEHGMSFVQGHLAVVWHSHGGGGQGMPAWFDIAPAGEAELASAMDAADDWLGLFGAMGIPTAVLHMGGSRLAEAGWPDEAIFARRVEALSAIAASASHRGITICLENMAFARCGVQTLEDIKALIAAVDAGNLAVCLDTGHAVMAGLDTVQFVLNAGSLLQALHIHDNIGTGDDHVLPYERDTIPWSRVLAALREIDCAGPLNLEIPGRPGCPMPVREARLDYAHGVAAHMVRHVIGHRCQHVA